MLCTERLVSLRITMKRSLNELSEYQLQILRFNWRGILEHIITLSRINGEHYNIAPVKSYVAGLEETAQFMMAPSTNK